MNYENIIKPGQTIKIIFKPDDEKEIGSLDVRGSMVHDVANNEIIVGQTEPPITEKRLGEKVAITFIIKRNTGKTRYKLTAKIEELIKSYRLSSQEKIPAIRMVNVSNPEIYNMRTSYRVELPNRKDLTMFIYNHRVNLIDISLGGARITHSLDLNFKTNDILRVTIMIDKRPYEVDAQVVRMWYPHDYRFRETIQFVALKFLGMTMKMQDILARKLIEIQRDLRYKELFNA